MELETIGTTVLMVLMIGQLWQLNRTAGGNAVKDIEQDKELFRLAKNSHKTNNTLQTHEGRLTVLETKQNDN